MELIDTIIKTDNMNEREEERIYHSKDNLGLKNYLEIKNKFYDGEFFDMVALDQLCDLCCKVNVKLDYKIMFDNNSEKYLFSNGIIIDNMEERDEAHYQITDEWKNKIFVNGGISFYRGKFTIKVVVNIMYYKRIPLLDYKLD